MRQPLIACVGLVALDRVLEIDEPLGPGRKHFATTLVESCGGPAATAAATIVRLGGRARLAAQVGGDDAGSRILRLLDEGGIERSLVRRVRAASSSISTVVVAGDERTIVNHTDEELLTGPPTGDLFAEDVSAVLADCRWPEAAGEALRGAHANRIPGVLDLDRSPDREASSWLAGLAGFVVASRSGAETLVGHLDAPAAVKELSHFTDGWRAVTDGSNGVWWSDAGRVVHTPAPEVDAVETIGAGDVFHGAFVLGLARGEAPEAAVRFASAAAAVRCTRRGGWDALPTPDEVDRMREATWS